MIARVWQGVVPTEKAEAYAHYLSDSERGVDDYARTPGNRGFALLRRAEKDRVRFILVSFWDSVQAIEEYAGPDVERARYFPFDLECLVAPEPRVEHFEVVRASLPDSPP